MGGGELDGKVLRRPFFQVTKQNTHRRRQWCGKDGKVVGGVELGVLLTAEKRMIGGRGKHRRVEQ